MSRRALITGGAGFIGSHLADALLAEGWRVDVVDDLSTGSMANVDHLLDHPRFSFTADSVMKETMMAQHVDRADVIYHLAAAVGVRLIVEEPVRTIQTNIRATEILLELAANKKKRVLIASTSEVYGKLRESVFSEDGDLLLGPTSASRWCYAASKIVDEFLALAYWHEKGLPTTVLRFFNTIGPRQTGQYGMVVPRFVGQALANEPITVYGDGRQKRSFTWIGDVVDALVKLADNPASFGEVLNIGHKEEISIRDLAELVRDLTGSSSEIVLVPFEEAYAPGFEDVDRRMPDLRKIEKLIGYAPSKDLRAMLEAVTEHERARRGLAEVS